MGMIGASEEGTSSLSYTISTSSSPVISEAISVQGEGVRGRPRHHPLPP
jgi:hypothetical protein